ncbi:MAG: hypothetical protein WKF77_08145 [Planctomycetaceae bacterium]
MAQHGWLLSSALRLLDWARPWNSSWVLPKLLRKVPVAAQWQFRWVCLSSAALSAFVVPIPIVGSVIGAILGAAIGAFAGAWLGEAWKGTVPALRNEIGTAAMSGRLLGMLAKGVVGVAIFVVQLVSFWL